jgi:hypothetical protein
VHESDEPAAIEALATAGLIEEAVMQAAVAEAEELRDRLEAEQSDGDSG